MNRLKRQVGALLLKRRTVFRADRVATTPGDNAPPEGYTLAIDPDLTRDEHAYASLAEHLGEATLAARVRNPSVTLFLLSEARTGRVAGWYWAATSEARELWHDNFPIPRNCALLFNAVVMPEHRRRGLYRALIVAAQQHLLHDVGLSSVYTIVEDQNIASLKANQRFGGRAVATNFLVKALGVNAFSIYRSNISRQVNVHYVFRNSKSHRL